MSRFRQISQIAVIGLASVSGVAVLVNNVRKPVFAKPVDEDIRDLRTRLSMMFRPSFAQWDDNWDMYESKWKGKSKKNGKIIEDSVDNEPDIKPTAKRHLIFIRHGQYRDDEELDEKKILTELGRYSYRE